MSIYYLKHELKFSDDGKKLSRFSKYENISNYTVPDGVEIIESGAFWDVDNLESITLPSTLKIIENEAFSKCKSLKEITIPEGIETIENETFANCHSLESITLPSSLKIIENKAFKNCTSLREIVIPEGVKSIGFDIFSGCDNLESIKLPSTLKSGLNSLSNCKNLKEIEVNTENPDFTSVDGVLFSKDMKTLIKFPPNKNQTSYIVPEGVEKIEQDAFKNCTFLREIVIPEGVKIIGREAFYGCENLESITLPSTLKEMGEGVFWSCNNNLKAFIPGDYEICTEYSEETWSGDYVSHDTDCSLKAYLHCNEPYSEMEPMTIIETGLQEKYINNAIDKIKHCINTGNDATVEVPELSLKNSQVREAIAEYVTDNKDSAEYKYLMSIEDNNEFYISAKFCAMCNQETANLENTDIRNVDLDD